MKIVSVRGMVTTLIVIISLPFSCIKDDDFINYESYYEVNSYQLSLGTAIIDSNTLFLYNSKQNSSLDSTAFLILVDSSTLISKMLAHSNTFGLGNQLYATTPEPIPPFKEHIRDIRIYNSDTIHTGNTFFIPNSELSTLFSAEDPYVEGRKIPIESYRNIHKGNNRYNPFIELVLAFNDSILPFQHQQLTFEIFLSDSSQFTLQSDILSLN